jgi:hypothetical protein
MSITAASSDGRTATLTGELFRARTKLPSTWFKDPVNAPLISEGAICDNSMRFVKQFCYE